MRRGASHKGVLGALAQRGCPACRARDFSDERLVYALATEHYADGGTLDALRASHGLCPAHSRRLLDRHEAPYVLRAVHAQAVAGALAGGFPSPCPLCRDRAASESATLEVVVAALADADVVRAYETNGGFCFPHARAALARARRGAAPTIVRALGDSLAAGDAAPSLVHRLAGTDPDRALRKEWRDRLCDPSGAQQGRPPESTLAGLHARLAAGACPACLAGGLLERRYLVWLGAQRLAHPDVVATDGIWLCPVHLHDLLEEDQAAAAWVANVMATRVREQSAQLGAAPPCAVCAAVAVAERSEVALLVAALADAPTERRYEGAHGLCARHVRALPEPATLPRGVLHARLLVLAWELKEAGRKSSWHVRHEAKGPERTAWRRAAAQLDGRTFLGGAPEPWRRIDTVAGPP